MNNPSNFPVYPGMNPYSIAAEKLTERIFVLIPTHPEIMTITSVWDLFKVPGFDCSDIGPSLAQASWALADARRRYRERSQ